MVIEAAGLGLILASVPWVQHRPGTGQSLNKSWLLSARGENGEAFVECNLAGPTHISVHASLCLSKSSSRNLAGRNTLAQATEGVATRMSGGATPQLKSPLWLPSHRDALEAQVLVQDPEWNPQSNKEVV